MLSEQQISIALQTLYGNDIRKFHPKRTWDGSIQVGDFVEATKGIPMEYGGRDERKYIGVVERVMVYDKGVDIYVRAATKKSDETIFMKEWIWTLAEGVYSRKNIALESERYSLRICKLFFSDNDVASIQIAWNTYLEEQRIAKERAAEEARLEAERKAKEEEELRQRAIKAQKEEEERRSQTMTITVGMWEDLMRRVQDLEFSVDND